MEHLIDRDAGSANDQNADATTTRHRPSLGKILQAQKVFEEIGLLPAANKAKTEVDSIFYESITRLLCKWMVNQQCNIAEPVSETIELRMEREDVIHIRSGTTDIPLHIDSLPANGMFGMAEGIVRSAGANNQENRPRCQSSARDRADLATVASPVNEAPQSAIDQSPSPTSPEDSSAWARTGSAIGTSALPGRHGPHQVSASSMPTAATAVAELIAPPKRAKVDLGAAGDTGTSQSGLDSTTEPQSADLLWQQNAHDALRNASQLQPEGNEEYIVCSLQCPICKGAVRGDSSGLEDHLRAYHKVAQHRCPFRGCNLKSFDRIQELNSHFNKVHLFGTGFDRSFERVCCSKEFGTVDDYSNHQTLAHQSGQFRCRVCGSEASTVKKAREHFYTEHRRKYLIHALKCTAPCCWNTEPFSTYEKLNEHTQNRHGWVGYLVQCPICWMDCINVDNVMLHIKEKHKADLNVPWFCTKCGGQIDLKTIQYHEKHYHQLGRFQCAHKRMRNGQLEQCNSKGINRAAVIFHFDQKHSQSK